jgi:hypothetical protein
MIKNYLIGKISMATLFRLCDAGPSLLLVDPQPFKAILLVDL